MGKGVPKMHRDKIKDYDVLVLTQMPSVLDEVGFVERSGSQMIVNPQSWRLIASIYANAINDTLNGVGVRCT